MEGCIPSIFFDLFEVTNQRTLERITKSIIVMMGIEVLET
jgi:hypothetical protein